ncbi:VASt domain containing protein [Gracilaria domingensis]|nr:VASt domain containing protein [Gracilaria domingensis]
MTVPSADQSQDAQPDLFPAASIYGALDNTISHTTTDPILPQHLPDAHHVKNEPVVEVIKTRKQMREERAQRLAAEQAQWVRHKFSLPDSEQLLASFSAALVKHILLQGRIHITTTALCFYAKIFGKVTKECYPFSSMARVKKRRGGFVANAIKIYFQDQAIQPVVIGSLNHRERAFETIQARLREVNPTAAEPTDADEYGSSHSIGNSHAGDSEDQSFDDNESNSNELQSTTRTSRDDVHSPRAVSKSVPTTPNFGTQLAVSDSSDSGSGKCAVQAAPPPSCTASESSLVWRTQHDVVDRVFGKTFEKKTERARGLLNGSVMEVFNIIFVSDWLKHYHEASNNKEVTFTDWARDEEGFMMREVNFQKPLGYKIGPKETRVKEKQRYSFTRDGGVIFELEGHNLDVLYGDYFVCESFFELIPQGDGSKTLMILSISVHFVKSTMLRGKIEAGALSETKVAFQRLYTLASRRVDEHISLKRRGSQTKKRQEDRNGTKSKETLPTKASLPVPSPLDIGESAKTIFREGTTSAHVDRQISNAVRVEVKDSESTKWLRIGALIALGIVCLLLMIVMMLLFRMRRDVAILEKLIAEAGLPTKCQAIAEG